MNDIKYVMLPMLEEKPKNIKQQPWYKERFKIKYLNNQSNVKSKSFSRDKILDAKQWTFVKDGLDDFRDGLPPPHDDLLIKNSKGPAPALLNDRNWNFKETVLPASARLTRNQRLFSKKLPLAQAKRDNIEDLVESLAEHPLAMHSHYGESLPSELFEEVLDILDPELNRRQQMTAENDESRGGGGGGGLSESEGEGGGDETMPRPVSASNTSRPTSKTIDESIAAFTSRKNIRDELSKLEEELKKEMATRRSESEKPAIRNTYKWLLKKEEAKARAKGPDPEQLKAIAIDNHIKKVTEQYCNWVKSLGGEHNIDPITLTSLFASGYDTKPPLSVPIHVVELNNIPAELRSNAYVPPNPNNEIESEKNIYRDDSLTSDHHHHRSAHNYRYGAWYLPKEHWRLMSSDEKLIDPRELKDTEKEEAKKRAEEINSKLAPLHGAEAFREFVRKKQPKRTPKLLEDIEEWKSEQQIKMAINNINQLSLSTPAANTTENNINNTNANNNSSSNNDTSNSNNNTSTNS